ncbi:imidazolonepropionase [Sphaeroforma arctica JP610]|uniref:Probable imidazolonepropionase n=1 Tax=Sphaeroforma arctica JP610 TaxID=667725 RepID=A0A0L0GA61_9EUKA|nr:imidazolonepropionase [Sphaeroforma arctica JP610]KNC85922.1 imidazolonepropionase [Sphaeroforma arctica JP610]|eukprot:XP_014159824.1 imidazolonepropionase [Sphaeroforma arctica JP610]
MTADQNAKQILWINGRLATCDPKHTAPYGAILGHAIHTKGSIILAIIPQTDIVSIMNENVEVRDLNGAWVTPGFIDSHTHLVYGGNRAQEWEKRLNGVPYEQIAAEGGGIVSTVKATRELSLEDLVAQSSKRLEALIAEGVTTVEIKSGYGLNLEDELKQLTAAKQLSESYPVEVASTCLSAHAVPPEFKGRTDEYIDEVVNTIIPACAKAGLCEAVDVFCESVGFSREQCRRVFECAKAHGLKVKGHVEQLTNQHGAELVAEYKGLSCDHIEYLDEAGVKAMAESGTVAVLSPGAYYFLRETQKPPIDTLRAHGVNLAVATDLNPGTSPSASIRMAMNMACVLFGLTPEESVFGVTRNAAKALGRGETHGMLKEGYVADLLIWNVDHPSQLAYSVGTVGELKARVYRGVDNSAKPVASYPGFS